jgi:hypothetical protein
VQSQKKTAPAREELRAKAKLAVAPQPQPAADQRAVDEGRRPLESRRKDVAELRARALELYGIPAAGLAAPTDLESQFQFAALDSDADFNYLHVGPLLDQAAGLLDRCAVARTQRDRLQMEKWKLALELDGFFRLGQLQERERQAGVDTLPYQRAVMESGAENSLESNHKSAEAQLAGLMDDLVASGFNKRMAARELSAWLAAYPLKDADLRGDDAGYTFDGARKTKPEHLFDAARIAADEAAWEQIADLMARRFAAMAASEAGRLRKESLDLQAKWSLADIGFRRERAQVERDALWEKVYQAQSPGGLFHYGERMAPLERQFSMDFREALARLTAARRGLRELYGHAPEFPQAGTAGYFDAVVTWVSQAQRRLTQFSQADQNYVLAVSLKELAKADWEAGRTAGQWSFEVPQELFDGQAHVRLRGLGLAVVAEPEPAETAPPKAKAGQKVDLAAPPPPPKPAGFWSARLTLPPVAAVRHLSGQAGELDQKSLPPVYLGRVADRDSPREPEIAGLGAAHNASPIGKPWKLALSSKSTDGTATANLGDVMLYLHVAVRGVK